MRSTLGQALPMDATTGIRTTGENQEPFHVLFMEKYGWVIFP